MEGGGVQGWFWRLPLCLCPPLGELTRMLVLVEFDDGCRGGCVGCRLQLSHFCDGGAVLLRLSSHHSPEEGDEMSTWRDYSAKTFGGVKGRQTGRIFLYAPPTWCDGDAGCYRRGARHVAAQLSRKDCVIAR